MSLLLRHLAFRRNHICCLCLKCSLEIGQISIQAPFYIRIYQLQDKHVFVSFYLQKMFKINIFNENEVFFTNKRF